MDANQYPAPTRLPIGRSLRAHLPLVISMTVLGALLFGGAAALLPRTYTATTSVLVRPLTGNPYSPDAQGSDLTNLETEAQIVTSDAIVGQVEQAKSDVLPNGIQVKRLTVSVAPNTQIIRVSYTNPSPEIAAAVADDVAQRYLEFRTERRDATVEEQTQQLNARIAAVNEQLAKLRKQNRPEDDPEVKSVGGQLLNLRLQLSTLGAAERQPGEVIAQTPARRAGIAIPPWAAAIVGGLLGLAVGFGLALNRERLTEIVRTVDDLEHLGITVLGHETGSAAQTPTDSALMAGAVVNRRVPRPATIAVTQLSGFSGADSFAEDLAHALSLGADDVLVIDAVPGRALASSRGLSDVMRGRPLARVVQKDDRGFSLLGPGRAFEGGERWFATMRFSGLLQECAGDYAIVLVHGEGSDSTPGRALVGACDYWIPLVALGKTSRPDLERAMSWAATVGTRILGVVAFDSVRGTVSATGAPSSTTDE